MAWPSKNPWSSVGKSPAKLGAEATSLPNPKPVSDPATSNQLKPIKMPGIYGKVGRPRNPMKTMIKMMTKGSGRKQSTKGY